MSGVRSELSDRPWLDDEQFRSIVNAAIWAPSADNHHALEFGLDANAIDIWADPAFPRLAMHRRVLGLISLGAVIENIQLRSAELGFRCTTRLFPSSTPEHVASVRLHVSDAARASDLASAIFTRQTNRRFFHGPSLTAAERTRIAAEASSSGRTHLWWLDEKEQRRKFLALARMAEAARFGCAPLHHELFEAIRFDVGWQAAANEGLAPASLEIERLLRASFKLIANPRVMTPLARIGVQHLLAWRSGDLPCRLAPHIGVIASEKTVDLDEAAFEAGRTLQRTWLRLTTLGVEVQPLAATTVFALDEYEDVPPRIRQSLAHGWAALLPDTRPLIAFRAGHASPPTMRNGRMPVDRYLRKTTNSVPQ